MDSTNAVASQSIEAVNQILKTITKESTDQAVKLMKATVSTTVGQEMGKGNGVDVNG
jgi:hypothetical protein